ncbi:hypothetical protein ACFMPD_10560 [Sedimentitalea sp. HM32M-2]|uniref:hypothetical protein n=1 Tax=Sedimentitalea sp. HM32M-2 TaxID=3351566 RepID=UPI003625E9C5
MTREIGAAHDMDLTGFHADLNEGLPLAGLDDPPPANVAQPQFSDPLKAGRTTDPDRAAIVKDLWDRQLAAQKERKAGA